MTDKYYDITDVYNFAVAGQPLELEKAVDAVLVDKIAAAIEQKKTEVAAHLFTDPVEDDSYEVEDEDDVTIDVDDVIGTETEE